MTHKSKNKNKDKSKNKSKVENKYKININYPTQAKGWLEWGTRYINYPTLRQLRAEEWGTLPGRDGSVVGDLGLHLLHRMGRGPSTSQALARLLRSG